jgi:hypothetical protein
MKLLNLLFLFSAIFVFASCKKDGILAPSPLASLNVTNAVVGGAALTLNTSVLTVGNNSYAQFALNAGQSQVNLYPAATPLSPYYNQTIPTNNGDYYSLFLAGASPANVDAILVKETYKSFTDTLFAVRFINLSPNSNPISVNISGNANGSEVTSLAYKAYTSSIQHSAKAAFPSYTFQIRDVATGNLIASTTLTTPRYRNVTIVLRGLVGGAPAAGITTVNDY